MKQICILCVVLLLFGCARPSATETIAENAKETVSAIYESLPVQCKTDFNKKQTETAQKAIDAVVASCNDQKQIIVQEKLRWKWSFFALAVAIAMYVARKILK